MIAAQGRWSINGTATQAVASSAPTATSAARRALVKIDLPDTKGQSSSGRSTRYPVSKCNAIVSDTSATAAKKLRPSRIARQLNPQASGSVHDAHSWVHTPYPTHTYAFCS